VAAVEGDRLNLPDVQAVRERRGLARQFGLTFRTGLESNERLTEGTTWTSPWLAPASDAGPMAATPSDIDTEVTVEEELFDESGLSIGDRIRFDVAGYSIRARIVGVRSVDWEDSQNGGFVFVLRPSPVVQQAPHSYVGFLQVRDDGERRGALQRVLVESHPNVSVIDVRDALAAVRDVVDNVTLGITIVGAVVLTGGVLILIGAVAMTKFQRLYETAIYRSLGASMRLVATTMAVEYGLLGTLAGLVGTTGGLALSWGLARYLFDIEWRTPGSLLVTGVLGTGVVVTLVGILASTDVLLRKPLATLRSE
jgi:putative ABC transport system permease protein